MHLAISHNAGISTLNLAQILTARAECRPLHKRVACIRRKTPSIYCMKVRHRKEKFLLYGLWLQENLDVGMATFLTIYGKSCRQLQLPKPILILYN
ncbi:hypothetical protein EVAR_95422_1 [Eumeta japonica]|uniref:Uncharacterized protein n=1 Tax=Eumeta variegata TaxID=151549 RepID=A0A4C1VIV5_EUMVA|nr:hypothetical protein EVAR_95422_1 [Eumeta japonica]